MKLDLGGCVVQHACGDLLRPLELVSHFVSKNQHTMIRLQAWPACMAYKHSRMRTAYLASSEWE